MVACGDSQVLGRSGWEGDISEHTLLYLEYLTHLNVVPIFKSILNPFECSTYF